MIIHNFIINTVVKQMLLGSLKKKWVQTERKLNFSGGEIAYKVKGRIKFDANLPSEAKKDSYMQKMYTYKSKYLINLNTTHS